jgi:hypothetical protein
MPPAAVATPLIATDPGWLFWAPLGTAEPTHAVTGSVFSDVWPAAWIPLGATDGGSTFNWQTTTDQVLVAEFLDPIKYIATGRSGSISFSLASVHMENFRRSMNGGTVASSGTGATSMRTYTPPALGADVRCMIGWESQDSTERLIAYQAYNSGQVSISRAKGTAKATLNCEFNLEVPASGNPFKYLTAGVARAGT